jgi:ubiquinone/menaquinone biosynthesis C-methylase UbiE
MKLNYLEFIVMNNSVRRIIQDKYELKILRQISSIKNIDNALEIGCGNGYGSKLIKKHFYANNIVAIDLDERMIKIANKRNKDTTVTYKVMDASKLDLPDNSFDVVFDFGIIHHIPNWKDCIDEIKRVLKPNGELILEDLSIESFTKDIGKLWRILTDHPYNLMYSAAEFTEYMTQTGFEIINYKESNPLKFIRHFSLNAIKKVI